MLRVRHKAAEFEALHYDGSFEIAFLRDGEQVRAGVSAGVSSIRGGCEVITPRGTIHLMPGDWLLRDGADLIRIRASVFELDYELAE